MSDKAKTEAGAKVTVIVLLLADVQTQTDRAPEQKIQASVFSVSKGSSSKKDIRSDDLASVLASGNLIAVNANLGKKLYESLNK